VIVGSVEPVPQCEQPAAHFLASIEDRANLIPAPSEAVNAEDGDTVNGARCKVNQGVIEPWTWGAWLPARGNVLVGLDDDAHVVVSDVIDEFHFLAVGGLLGAVCIEL
jgi:hypothetical protein